MQAQSHHQMEPARDQEIGSGRLQRCGRWRPSRQAHGAIATALLRQLGPSISGARTGSRSARCRVSDLAVSPGQSATSELAASIELFTLLIPALVLVRTISTNHGASRMRKKKNSGVAGKNFSADEELLTVAQVAENWQVSERKIRRMIAEDQLPIVRLGRAVRIPVNAVTR
jgi:excisionase family DNA binding protein